MAKPTIAIDADVLGRDRAGDEVFTAELLRAFGGMDLPYSITAYVRDATRVPEDLRHHPTIRLAEIPVGSNYVRGGIATPLRLHRDRPDVYQGNYLLPPALPCPGVVIVHDTSYMHKTRFMPVADRLAFRCFVPWSVRRAAVVATVSEYTRRDLLACMPGLDPASVVHVPLGVSRALAPVHGAADIVRKRFGINVPYVLFLGALDPRKNLIRLLEAWSRVKAGRDVEEILVIAGSPKSNAEPIEPVLTRLGIGDSVRLIGYVRGDELRSAVFSAARLFVFPSLAEGFGLPPLEAMACGIPVLASNATALPETTGGAALLADPYSVDDWTAAMATLLRSPRLREELSATGLKYAATMTWARTAETLAGVYDRILSQKRVAA